MNAAPLFPALFRKGSREESSIPEAQISNSERLLLSVLRSAVEKGADVANYLEAVTALHKNGRILGITARDVLTGDDLEIRARVVGNSAGPWVDRILELVGESPTPRKQGLSKAFNLLVDRPPVSAYAVGLPTARSSGRLDKPLTRGSRMLFFTPWQEHAFIGTAHLPYGADPDALKITEEEVQAFINEINEAYPPIRLSRGDVRVVYGGLLPAAKPGSACLRLLNHYQIQEHHADYGLDGLISVRTVKYTEARHVAERVIDLVFGKRGKVPPKRLPQLHRSREEP